MHSNRRDLYDYAVKVTNVLFTLFYILRFLSINYASFKIRLSYVCSSPKPQPTHRSYFWMIGCFHFGHESLIGVNFLGSENTHLW